MIQFIRNLLGATFAYSNINFISSDFKKIIINFVFGGCFVFIGIERDKIHRILLKFIYGKYRMKNTEYYNDTCGESTSLLDMTRLSPWND